MYLEIAKRNNFAIIVASMATSSPSANADLRTAQTQQCNIPEQRHQQKNQTAVFQAQAATDVGSSSDGNTMPMISKQIQNMIQASVKESITSAFSSMGISGQSLFTAFSSLPMSLSSSWIIDSGTSNHMISIDHQFTYIQPCVGHEHITAANAQHLSISRIRSIDLTTLRNQSFSITYVFFVPNLSTNLLLLDIG